MTIGERIKNRRTELGLSVDFVAAKLNKNRATIYRYESDEIENLPITILEPLAAILQTTPAYLMGWEDRVSTDTMVVKESGITYGTNVPEEPLMQAPLTQEIYFIPVLGAIPAGVAIEAVQDIIRWEEIPRKWLRGNREYFALQVKGDSMFPEYLDGDTVIIRKQPCCDSGDDCAVIINAADATLKRVHILEDGIEPYTTACPADGWGIYCVLGVYAHVSLI